MRPLILRVSLAGLLGIAAAHAEVKPPGAREVGKLFSDLCSGCHGEHMEGGKAPSLLHGPRRFGSDDASLQRSILEGHPADGMPAFASAVSVAEARALVAFIRETKTRAVEPQPREEQPLPAGIQHSELHDYRIESIAEGFDVPWSLAFLPDGRLLVTERVGRLRVIEHGRLLPAAVAGIPENILVRDEAGLMSVVADPDYAHNGWIYLSYSDRGPDHTAMTRIVRGRLRDDRWTDQQEVFAAPHANYMPSTVLFGGRLAFAGAYLFFSVGERGMEETTTGDAQDLALPNGKIHRVFPDGRIPPDNPYAHRPGAFPSIWAHGVRNPQGLALNPADGALWETEHGPRGGDELNVIEPGKNYGWPLITYGMNYEGTPISAQTAAPGLEQPVIDWTPSIAVSEIEFYRGGKFPCWRGHLFIGSLAQQKLLRVEIDGHRVVHREEIFHGLGRIRDIKTGSDGCLYLALELIGKPGRIVRLVPAD